MVVQYLIVSSGTDYLSQDALDFYGASNWNLVHVGQSLGSLKIVYIFSQTS